MPGIWDWERESDPRWPPQARPASAGDLHRRRRTAAGFALIALLALPLNAIGGGTTTKRALAPVRPPPAPPSAVAVAAAQDRAISAVLARTPIVVEGGGRRREIALTFDDGPGPYTPRILDILRREHVPATFFVVGSMERYFSQSTVAAVADGHVIENHTETHPFLARLNRHDQALELTSQEQRMNQLGVAKPRLFRPPYGSFNRTTLSELRRHHLLMVLWSADTEDFARPGVAAIVKRAVAGAHPGAIILMHDAGGTRTQTAAALPIIVRRLRARGYRLVTVPQLMLDDPPPPGQPIPTKLIGG